MGFSKETVDFLKAREVGGDKAFGMWRSSARFGILMDGSVDLALDKGGGIAPRREGSKEPITVSSQAFIRRANSLGPGGKTVWESTFGMKRVATVEMEVLLQVGGFDVN